MQPEEEPTVEYKLGLFYYSPADKRILVPKRSGLGWTLNFGNWWSYLVIIILICGSVISIYLACTQTK